MKVPDIICYALLAIMGGLWGFILINFITP